MLRASFSRALATNGGLLRRGEAHFDRGAKKPCPRKHRSPRRCAIPPGFLFPLIRRGSPLRHDSRGDEGCRVPRVQIPVASAGPPSHTPDASSSARIPLRPVFRAFAESHRECPLCRCRGAGGHFQVLQLFFRQAKLLPDTHAHSARRPVCSFRAQTGRAPRAKAGIFHHRVERARGFGSCRCGCIRGQHLARRALESTASSR